MIDINSVMPQLSVLQQRSFGAIETQPETSFNDVLSQKIQTLSGTSKIESSETIDTISTLPDDVRSIIKSLINHTPLDSERLNEASQKLATLSRRLVQMVNSTLPGPQSAQIEIDLHFVILGTFQILENYGHKSAVSDLMETWKSLDTRTTTYDSLLSGLVDFIKTKACPCNGLKDINGALPSGINPTKITWELQYEMWAQISATGNNLRSQPLLKEFNEKNQMASAKVDFNGLRIDSLIDPITPSIEF